MDGEHSCIISYSLIFTWRCNKDVVGIRHQGEMAGFPLGTMLELKFKVQFQWVWT